MMLQNFHFISHLSSRKKNKRIITIELQTVFHIHSTKRKNVKIFIQKRSIYYDEDLSQQYAVEKMRLFTK